MVNSSLLIGIRKLDTTESAIGRRLAVFKGKTLINLV